MNIQSISTEQLISELKSRLNVGTYAKYANELTRLAWEIIEQNEHQYNQPKRRSA